MKKSHNTARLPQWLKRPIITGKNIEYVKKLLTRTGLNTICFEAKCPNKGECFSRKEVTFIIGGKFCTRNCRYCNVEPAHGQPEPLDKNEPSKIAQAIQELGLKYVVLTSVTRDDLEDGGAAHFIETVKSIKELSPGTRVELLIPDFNGNMDAVYQVCKSGADVIGHNIEVAGERLFSELRPEGNYQRSHQVLKFISQHGQYCKSGFMTGFGETMNEIENTLHDLAESGVNIVTAGQYLAPAHTHFPVQKYYSPEEFHQIEKLAIQHGIDNVKCGSFVRSSYLAGDIFFEK